MIIAVLLVAATDGIEACAALIEQQFSVRVEVAANRRAALVAVRQMPFDLVVVEEQLVEGDPAWAARLWECTATATSVIVNFATSGPTRLTREVGAALKRRALERAQARKEAAADIANELKTPLTGLLLESELAMRDPAIPASLRPKLRHMLELVGVIRERLRPLDAAGHY